MVVFPDPVGPVTRMIPLGRRMRFRNFLKSLLRQAQLPDADLDVVLVQEPHHARLAMVGGQHADPQVELLAAGGDLDPAVLAAAAFGDVHLGQNLDAGEQGPQQPPRRAVALDQHAVDPVANPHPVFERLDVDVRGPQLHRLADHQLHQPHDRGAGLVDVFAAAAVLPSSVSVKSIAVSVNSCSIESADSPPIWP